MLKQKSKASLASPRKNVPMYHQQALFNEVGAWTAAINACGKTGRVDTALTNCLLKTTPIRMKDTLEVLQYMKQEGLVPGEVMYTSLMGVALSLAEKENKSVIRKDGLQVSCVPKYAKNILLCVP